MPSFTEILTAGALASLALAVPVSHASCRKGHTITGSIPVPLPAAAVQYANAFAKYGKRVPDPLAAAAAQQTGSVTASPEAYDVAYLCPVTIGGQTLNLDFDTGSADLWVFSSELPAATRQGHNIYNPAKSKTSRRLPGATWNITYGDGSSASGDVYTDVVTVGGISVQHQAVELASQVSAQFAQNVNNDGLLGLAFSSINTVRPNQQTTWFDSGRQQGLFQKNLFTVDLKHNAPGTYDFGYIDNSKHTGTIEYTSINPAQGFWQFTGTGYQVGQANSFQSTNIDAIADTGTTLLLMDDSIVTDYYSNVNGAQYDNQQGGYVFPCNSVAPDMILGIGQSTATIPGSLMSLGPIPGTNSCFGGLQSNAGIGISIYGDIFLKAVLAVFDADNLRFGYAPKTVL